MARPARESKSPTPSSAKPRHHAAAAENSVPVTAGACGQSITDRLTFLVHMVSARIALLGNRHFREHDLNHFSARILVLLLEMEALRTGELVDLMLLPQSTISSQLLALQKKGLIRRRRSRQDNRSVIVTLTPAGRELAEDCEGLSVRANAALLKDIPNSEWQPAFDFLRRVNTTLVELEKHNLYPFHDPRQVEQLVALEKRQPATRRATHTIPTRSKKMIKHIVVWRLKESAGGNDRNTNARLIKQKLEGLRGRIEGLLAIEVGIDFSATPTSSHISLYSEFTDREALDRYQAHPLHKDVVGFVKDMLDERRMVDYEA